MSYANIIDVTDFHAAAIDEGALFDHSDLDDILVHLETNVEGLNTLARDVIAH